MATVQFMLLCDYAFATEDKPCLIGIFESINAPVFPHVHPHFAVGIQLEGQPNEDARILLTIAHTNGRQVARAAGNARLGLTGKAYVALHFISVNFPEAGPYIVTALINDQPTARTMALQQARQ